MKPITAQLPSPSAPLREMTERGAIIDPFLKAAQAHPLSTALVTSSGDWTYERLLDRVNALATAIQRVCTAEDGRVAIVGLRTASFVLAVLACSRAGKAFALIDGNYPSHKIGQQLATIQPHLTLWVERTATDPVENGTDTCPSMSIDAKMVDDLERAEPLTTAPPDTHADAYFLFTSGSTGLPKCICTPHGPLRHFTDFYIREFSPTDQDRFSMLSGIGHDPVLRDIFVPLSLGATLVIPDQGIITDHRRLFNWVQDEHITFMHATPQLLRIFSAGSDARKNSDLKFVFSGGDAIASALAGDVHQCLSRGRLVNFYGTTETPQAMAFHVLDRNEADPVPIGRGIDDVQILVLDEASRLCTPGQLGQVAVRTFFRSNGYWGDPDATRQKYLPAPHPSQSGDTYYLTGDLGVYRDDGAVIIKGRSDDQVKIRGFRIELAEVSHAISALQGVATCVVLPHQRKDGENALAAFVVTREPKRAGQEQAMRKALADVLPSHMVPAQWVWLDSLPLLPNGKTDRQGLLNRLQQSPPVDVMGPLSSEDELRSDLGRLAPWLFGRFSPLGALTESAGSDAASAEHDPRLVRILQEIRDATGSLVTDVSHSFIELGGDSLSHIRVSMVIEDQLGYLPENWDTLPLNQLVGPGGKVSAQSKSTRPGTTVEISIPLRALSIMLVVCEHITLIPFTATSLMFAIAGISFARFQRPNILLRQSTWPIWHYILLFSAPAIVWHFGLVMFNMRDFWLPNFVMMGTFFPDPRTPVIGFWFLDVLAANILVLGLISLWWGTNDSTEQQGETNSRDYRSCLVLLILCLVLAGFQAIGGIGDGLMGASGVSPFKWLWLLVLGMLIALSQTATLKLGTTMLIALLAISTQIPALHPHAVALGLNAPLLYAGSIALIWIERISMHHVLRSVLVTVASASLFIFISHMTVLKRIPQWIGVDNVAFLLALALLVGIAFQRIWDLCLAVLWAFGRYFMRSAQLNSRNSNSY